MNTTPHPSELALLRVAEDDRSSDADMRELRTHLDQCAACRSTVQRNVQVLAHMRAARSPLLANDALWARIQQSRAMGIPIILPDPDEWLSDHVAASRLDEREAMEDDAPHAVDQANHENHHVPRPPVAQGSRTPLQSWTIRMALAASLAIVAIGTWQVMHTSSSGDASVTVALDGTGRVGGESTATAKGRETTPPSTEQSLLQALSPWPTMAYAQTPAPGRPAPYPPLTGLDARRLKEGRRWYLRSSANDYHTMLPHALTSVETAKVKWKQKAAWRLVTREPMRDNAVSVDTLIVLDSTLQPVFRRTHVGFMEVREEFADSVVTETFIMRPPPELMADLKTSRTGRSMAANLRAQKPMVTTHRIDRRRITPLGDHSMRLLLQAAPLTATWKGSVDVFVRVLNTQTTLRPSPDANYLNLRVDGMDTVQVFNGRIEVWRVLLETGPKPEVWYVSRETGETIMTEGAWGPSYPQSTNLLMGWHETKRLPPVRIR